MPPMTNAIATDFSSTGFIRRVLHPSDLSEESMAAFAHALKAALVAKGKLVLMHVTNDGAQEWTEFPGVRETLERWKLLPPGSRRQAVLDLGIEVNKVIGRGPNPTAGVSIILRKRALILSFSPRIIAGPIGCNGPSPSLSRASLVR